MRRLGRPYLQHGTRHLPHGSDPLPPAAFAAPHVPVALYTASADLPITHFVTSSEALDLDTFVASTEADGSTYFDVSGGTAALAPGFYLAVGWVEFFTIADWSGVANFLELAFETPFNFQVGASSFYDTNDAIATLTVSQVLNIPSGFENVRLAVGTDAFSINPLPENIVNVQAAFTRLNENI